MNSIKSLKAIGEYIYLTFPIRRLLLLILLVLSIFPGFFIFQLPLNLRFVYAYIYISVTCLSAYCTMGVFKDPIIMGVASAIFGRKYALKEYKNPGLEDIITKMGIRKHIEIYETSNPWVKGPFTNALSCKIYIPVAWLKRFPPKEILSIIAHELAHVKRRKSFAMEIIVVMSAVLASSVVLEMRTLLVVVDIFEFALLMLFLTYFSRRNESQADMEGARATGPEGLISVFEQLKEDDVRDFGSETHPKLSDRIKALYKMLNESEPLTRR
ncbi:MAG: M48 family metallopeptidase [Thaumarchaeota archaeon]|nr:M48 family metallopeptidase [Nitrososphaerota archaeon]